MTASERREGRLLLAALMAVFALSVILPHTPFAEGTVCVIKLATGYDCPGCGLGRSFIAMSALDPVGAFQAHRLGPLLYVLGLAWLVRTAARLRASRPDV